MVTLPNRPTTAQEGPKTESRRATVGATTTPPSPVLMTLSLLLVLAVASGLIVGIRALTDRGHDEQGGSSVNSGKLVSPPMEMPWLQLDLRKLVGSPVLPAQMEVLPARSITLRVTTPKGNLLSWSLATTGGTWGETTNPTELEVRLTSGAAEELRPTLEKFVAGGKFSAGEQSELGVTIAKMNFLGQLEMTRRNL